MKAIVTNNTVPVSVSETTPTATPVPKLDVYVGNTYKCIANGQIYRVTLREPINALVGHDGKSYVYRIRSIETGLDHLVTQEWMNEMFTKC